MQVTSKFSQETLELFHRFLESATINVGGPDFEEASRIALQAKKELAIALELVALEQNNQGNGLSHQETEGRTKKGNRDNASAG